MRIAEQAIEELRSVVDAMIVIPNDRLLSIISKETTAKSAFAMCDEVLRQAVKQFPILLQLQVSSISTLLTSKRLWKMPAPHLWVSVAQRRKTS